MSGTEPIRSKYAGGDLGLSAANGWQFVAQMAEAIRFFRAKNYHENAIKMQIPLPLQRTLMQVTAHERATIPAVGDGLPVRIMGVDVLPAYECRIVLYVPDLSFSNKHPLAVIDFDVIAGECQQPALKLLN